MDTANVVSLLHRVAHDAAEERKKIAEKAIPATTWRFNKNITLMINPEVKCPGCEKWWPTGRVWLVDEKNERLSKAWTLDGARLPLVRAHPHASSDGGEICLGDFGSASQALVAGLNRDSYYNSVATFLRGLGDDCYYANEEYCQECENFNHIDNMYKAYDGYWTCNECNPDREEEKAPRFCIECEAELDDEQESYCSDCCCSICVASRAEQEEDYVRE